MPTPEKELDVLGKEQEKLSGTISRFALITFALLLSFVVAFSRAYQKIDAGEVRSQVAEARRLGHISGESPDLSYIYLLFPEEAHAAAPITREPTQQEMAAATQKRLLIEKALEEQAKTWFNIKVAALGSSLEIDLRYCIFLLPLLFWASAVRLHLLMRKEYTVRELASHIVRSADAAEATRLDHLLYDQSPRSPTAYARQPARIERAAYLAAVGATLAYLFIDGRNFWILWGWTNLGKIAGVLASITFYLWLYCHAATLRLDAQLQSMVGLSPRTCWTDKLRDRLSRWSAKVRAPLRARPRLSMSTGCLLISTTLLLGMARSCDNQSVRYKGYELLRSKTASDAIWPVAGYSDVVMSTLSGGKLPLFAAVGLSAYCATLSLAALSIMVVPLSLSPMGALRLRWTTRVASRIAAFLLLLLLADVGVGYWFDGSDAQDVVSSALGKAGVIIIDVSRLVFGLLPFLLWRRLASPQTSHPAARLTKRRITNLLAPVLLSSAIALPHLAWSGYTGIPVLFVGLTLLALGCIELSSRMADLGAGNTRTEPCPAVALPPAN
jgi:hypothetical protein